MYQIIDGVLALSVNDWLAAGLTYRQFRSDSKNGLLEIAYRSIHGNTLIDARSIRRTDRRRAIEAAYGVIEESKPSIYNAKISQEAKSYYISYRKNDGTPLEHNLIEQYTNRASLLEALKKGLEIQQTERAKTGKRIKTGEWYAQALKWYNEQREHFPCAEITNVRSFERIFKSFLKDGYSSVISGKIGNDNTRKVSVSMENLLLSLWRTNDKPFIDRVWELYNEFISGDRELYDKETGELFRPEDFRHKGRSLSISKATVWGYLKDVVNCTAVYADRNGNFDYQNSRRPKHVRKLGQYSLSKISMDDVALSRKTKDGKWVYKYIAVDVLSGYYFRPAYIVGKPNENTVLEAFRNMFCELQEMGLPSPGELEVEHHLMEHIDWLNAVFPFVRFCSSATEKRAEHNIRALKYGSAKEAGHTFGRWYAKHEAYKSVRAKIDGDYTVASQSERTLIVDDIEDIERHNNELHPQQKLYPGMTRKDVLLSRANPNLKAIEPWYLYHFIGNKTATSIVNNNRLMVQGEHFELADFASLERMKSNSKKVEAYWLPNEDGGITTAYLYQEDTYIGEAFNMEQYRYNEFAIERTEEDEAAMLHQQKRVAKFDKMIRERRSQLPHVGGTEVKTMNKRHHIVEDVEIVEASQPANYDGDEFETADYAAIARELL